MNSTIHANVCNECYSVTLGQDSMRESMLYVTAISMLLLATFGLLFNSLFIYILITHNTLKTKNNLYVMTLCVSSILIAVLVVPTLGISSLEERWVFGDAGCTLHGFIMTSFGLFQIFIITAMSFEKYVIVVKNSWYLFVSKTGTRFSIGGSLLMGITLGSCPIIGWNSYKLEIQNVSCSIDWSDKGDIAVSFTYLLLMVGFVMPVSIMLFSYISIFLEIRGHIFNLRKMLRNSGKCYANMLKREVKAIKTMLILVCAFIVSWLPYVILSMYAMFGEIGSVNPWLSMIPTLFAKASVIWNPIIYLFINKSFRNALMEKAPILRRCHSMCKDSKSRNELLSNETMPTPLFSKDVKSQSFDQQHTVRISNPGHQAITTL
ncbi:rhodopsin, GQ-coupled-like [Pecten maximus]|uniref:rhodopsin, GQ-coupled-like n=1 Tax=Pecten maximus TaxID=6579 RepID=UPI001458B141|nr:rhodopsin, GQ-coupled-like [Pecten maximus]